MAGRFLRSFVAWSLTVILAALLAVGLGALVPGPIAFEGGAKAYGSEDGNTRTILVLSNSIHTDIALRADPDVLDRFGFISRGGLELDYPGVSWIVFGWGSRAFYIETPTWADLKPGPVIKALTWDQSVMHVRRAGDIPLHHQDVRPIEVSQADFSKLISGIEASFVFAKNGDVEAVEGASYDSHDIFYPAHGGFNAFMGCNTWTAKMLRISGVKTGIWTPLPVLLTLSLALHK